MARRKMSQSEQEARERFSTTAAEVIQANVEDYVSDNYLPYAYSVCLDRALTYARDGLKPIQRRILYTAYKHNITDKSPKMKSAQFEGLVMKYSPHGGCYSSIVNMAGPEVEGQPRDLRVPLIRGKGNWGTLDEDAAAARYTEMSLWPAAMELVKELDENAVDMVPNYDGTTTEPAFLPARWPVALIQGVPSAMAVGFACNIPCHNPNEAIDACIYRLQNKNCAVDDIAKIIKGPDFNCGCDIISTTIRDGKPVDGIKEYLETGSGSFVMRAKYELEDVNGAHQIHFTHLPYKVGPNKVLESIKNAYDKGEFKELASWSDLSDRKNPVLIEIITKKGVNITKTLNELFKRTPLQSVFAANNTIVSKDNLPTKMSILQILDEFIDFRRQCTTRKLNFRLEKKAKDLSLNEAIAAVLVDIDKCIEIIRKSKDSEVARKKLMTTFKVDEAQANYILNIQLRKLTRSDSLEVKKKVAALKKEIKDIKGILASPKKMDEFIASELESTKEAISSPRKCRIYKRDKFKEDESKKSYISIDKSKVKRSMEKEDGAFEVNADGRVLVLSESVYAIRSIYELPEDKFVPMTRFKVGKPLCVAAHEGTLVLIGKQGALKQVDLSTMTLPKKEALDKVLSQDLLGATVIDGSKPFTVALTTNGKTKKIPSTEIPMQSIYANGKKFSNKDIDSYEIIQ